MLGLDRSVPYGSVASLLIELWMPFEELNDLTSVC